MPPPAPPPAPHTHKKRREREISVLRVRRVGGEVRAVRPRGRGSGTPGTPGETSGHRTAHRAHAAPCMAHGLTRATYTKTRPEISDGADADRAPGIARIPRGAGGEIRDPRTASATSTTFFILSLSQRQRLNQVSSALPHTPPTVPLRGYGRLSGGTPHCVNAL